MSTDSEIIKTTAQQLRQERPFLWLCTSTIASRSTSQQQILRSKIADTLARGKLLKSEQSVDFLSGLLAYVGWYGISQTHNEIVSYYVVPLGINYQAHHCKPSLSIFTQLARPSVIQSAPGSQHQHLNHA